MKFPNAPVSINTVEFNIALGTNSQTYPYKDTVKMLEFEDNSKEVLSYGTSTSGRLEINCDLTFAHNLYTDQVTLFDYFVTNQGSKIEVELQDGEEPWGPLYPAAGSTAFCIPVEIEPLGEGDFSPSREVNDFRVKLSYTGVTSGAELNTANTALYDILLEIDTNSRGADYIVADETARLALSPSEGEWAYQQDNFTMYYYESSAWVQEDTISRLVAVTTDDDDIGLSDGNFYFSSFTDKTVTGASISDHKPLAYKAGFISRKSIKFPNYNLNIENGPTIEKPEGFRFALANMDRFHIDTITGPHPFFGAIVKLYAWDKTNSQKVLIREGINRNNSFDFANYEFQIEPKYLMAQKQFPVDVLTKADYPVIEDDKIGVPIIQTYGQWKQGKVQNIGFNPRTFSFTDFSEFATVIEIATETIDSVVRQRITVNVTINEFVLSDQFRMPNLNVDDILAPDDGFYYLNLINSNSSQSGRSRAILGWKSNTVNDVDFVAFYLPLGSYNTRVIYSPSWQVDGINQTGTILKIKNGGSVVRSGVKFDIEGNEYTVYAGDSEDETQIILDPEITSAPADSATLTTTNLLEVGDVMQITAASTAYLIDDDICKGMDKGGIGRFEEQVDAFYINEEGRTVRLPFGLFKVKQNSKENYLVLDNDEYEVNDGGKIEKKISEESRAIDFGYGGRFNGQGDVVFFLRRVSAFVDQTRALAHPTQKESASGAGVSGGDQSVIVNSLGTFGQRPISTDDTSLPEPISKGLLQPIWVDLNSSSDLLYVSKWAKDASKLPHLQTFSVSNSDINRWFYRVKWRAGNIDNWGGNQVLLSWAYKIDADAKSRLVNKTNVRLLCSFQLECGDVSGDRRADTCTEFLIKLVGVDHNGTHTDILSRTVKQSNSWASPDGYAHQLIFTNSPARLGGDDDNYNAFVRKDSNDKYEMERVKDDDNLGDIEGTPILSSAISSGDTTVEIINLDAQTGTIKAGTRFSIAGFNQVYTTTVDASVSGGFAILTVDNIDYNYANGAAVTFYAGHIVNGKDFFLLPDSLFEDDGTIFSTYQYLAFEVYPNFFKDQEFIGFGSVKHPNFKDISIRLDNIYFEHTNEYDILTNPALVRIDGGKVNGSGDIIQNPIEIMQDILTDAPIVDNSGNIDFPNDKERGGRDVWKCRLQIDKQQDVKKLIGDIARQMHANIIFDTNGELILRSLDELDHDPVFDIDESNILKDSVSKVKLRDYKKIYQRYNIDYYQDWVKDSTGKTWSVYLDSNDDFQVEGLAFKRNSIGTEFEERLRISRKLYSDGNDNIFNQNFNLFYDDTPFDKGENDWPAAGFYSAVRKVIQFYTLNTWTMSVRVHMKYFIYDTGDLTGTTRLKLNDLITFKHWFHTNDVQVRGFIIGITPNFYDGYVTLKLWINTPPDALVNLQDVVWDGGIGDINTAGDEYKFRGEDYDLKDTPITGTYPDGGSGDISADLADYQFTDNTYADQDEDLKQ